MISPCIAVAHEPTYKSTVKIHGSFPVAPIGVMPVSGVTTREFATFPTFRTESAFFPFFGTSFVHSGAESVSMDALRSTVRSEMAAIRNETAQLETQKSPTNLGGGSPAPSADLSGVKDGVAKLNASISNLETNLKGIADDLKGLRSDVNKIAVAVGQQQDAQRQILNVLQQQQVDAMAKKDRARRAAELKVLEILSQGNADAKKAFSELPKEE
jgi:hypothetical protein